MATEQQIDRSVLAGKDRDELHTIAGAIGVKAATRMRKADLIDAILAAANGGEPAAEAAPEAPAAAPALRLPLNVDPSRLDALLASALVDSPHFLFQARAPPSISSGPDGRCSSGRRGRRGSGPRRPRRRPCRAPSGSSTR